MMDRESFNALLKNATELDPAQVKGLHSLLEKFPYFQSARALQLKGLYQNNSLSYNAALKKTASYTTDRSVLFDYITSKDFKQQQVSKRIKKRHTPEGVPQKTKSPSPSFQMDAESAERILDPHLFKKLKQSGSSSEEPYKGHLPSKEAAPSEAKNDTSQETPVHFDKSQQRSFSEWLKLTKPKPISRGEMTKSRGTGISQKEDLIDKFIKNAPKKISPKAKPGQIPVKDYELDHQLMTETLAEVYTKQKNYSKAIQAYKILILKNPEKSGLFADRIREIEISRENQNK